MSDEAFAEGYQAVCGVDEAGRGPLAGPVCAAAVILPAGLVIDGLNDSKKLTDKKRRELYDVITQNAVSYGIAMASEREIDEINILQATFLAMQRAIDKLAVRPDLALIDGNRAKDFGLPVRTIVKGDSLSASIAAASILAKVTRDRLHGGAGRSSIPNTVLPSTRATARSGTMQRCANTARARYTGEPFSKSSMANKTELGTWGEAIAAEALRSTGLSQLSSSNYSVALRRDRYHRRKPRSIWSLPRSSSARRAYFGAAREFVDATQAGRVCARRRPCGSKSMRRSLQPRFDVIEIYAPDGMQTKCPQIRQIEDAFI